MFKNNIVSLEDLNFIANRIDELDLEMSCNVTLINRIRLDLPFCSPFSMRDCVARNSEYRIWCALRDDVLTTIKGLINE